MNAILFDGEKKGPPNILYAITDPCHQPHQCHDMVIRQEDVVPAGKSFYGLRFKIFICNTN